MKPLLDSAFFRPPTRVSRLYPILALALLVTGSGVIYRWQITQINADTTVQAQNREIASLKGQLAFLTTQQEKDQTTLASQGKELKDAAAKLTEIESKLAAASSSLTEKEKALAEAEAKVQQQESQLSANTTELQQLRDRPPLFSFQNESNLADADQKEAQIKELVTTAYNYIQDLYGTPYLLNQITITFVNQFSIAGAAGEITIENSSKGIAIDIHLKDFDNSNFQDVNTLIHEIIHGFHGVAVMTNSALEEGETVAATDAVMERMIADNKLPAFKNLYIIINQTQYNQWNEDLVISSDNDAFYQSQDIAKIYQIIGYAWRAFYRQDPTFFKKLNETYYAEVQQGKAASRSLILESIKKVLPQVGSFSIDAYLNQNQAFNPR
jgi:hypothetical protein